MGPYPSAQTMLFYMSFSMEIWRMELLYVLTPKGFWLKWLSNISCWENPPILESGSMLNLLCNFGLGVNDVWFPCFLIVCHLVRFDTSMITMMKFKSWEGYFRLVLDWNIFGSLFPQYVIWCIYVFVLNYVKWWWCRVFLLVLSRRNLWTRG